MATHYKRTAVVKPGRRIEVEVPEFEVGETVDLVLRKRVAPDAPPISILEWMRAQPYGPQSAATWEEVERGLQAERNSWDE